MRNLLPDFPDKILKQRLYFLVPFVWTFLATRENSKAQAQFWKRFWADPSTMESLLDAAEGILVHPASSDTLRALGPVKAAPLKAAAKAAPRPRKPRAKKSSATV